MLRGYFSGATPSAAHSAPALAIIATTRAARVANNTHLSFADSSLREASNYTRTGHLGRKQVPCLLLWDLALSSYLRRGQRVLWTF
jgi:hypothetical protein